TQTDMMELVERIYLRYIVPHAEKEIMQLPTPLRSEIAQHFAGQITTPTDPHIFGPAKIHIHHLLQLVFPTFVHYKVLMNLTLKQQIGRIVAGLLGLMIGFSLEFSLIFLNIHPWQRRIWGLLPIGAGLFCLITGLAGLDPFWVLCLNIRHTTTFHFNPVEEPRVKLILRNRSIALLLLFIALTSLVLIVFCAVPGKRL
ncbi:hypothetical protein PHYBLDRAFT_89606, partial [Phycomyces blakesleeanus NRRL 1555(-)]